jgi:hypothetical protein
VYKILVDEPEAKIRLERPGSRWKDDIKMDVKETGWETVD